VSSNFIKAFGGAHLYPITDQHLSGLSHAEQVVLLINCGAAVIQLREKLDPPAKFFRQADLAVQVARDLGAKIIINDRVDIALAVKADGVHLGQEDLPPDAKALREFLKALNALPEIDEKLGSSVIAGRARPGG